MGKLFRASLLALILVVLTTGSMLAATPSSPTKTVSSTRTTHGSERVTLTAAECAAFKAANPVYASKPNICTYLHTWTATITETQQVKGANVAQAACPTGTAAFQDRYNDFTGLYWVGEEDSNFQWYGDCGWPALTHQYCYFPYVWDTTVSNISCYSYHYIGSLDSTAAVLTAYMTTTPIGGQTISSWNSERRECYSDYTGDCNWTGWNGQ